MTVQPLDIVKTLKGHLAVVTETNDGGRSASVEFFEPSVDEKNAWYTDDELVVIDSLPYLMARCMRHPFGAGHADAAKAFHRGARR